MNDTQDCIEFALGQPGASVLVSVVKPVSSGAMRSGAGERVTGQAAKSFNEALGIVGPVARAVLAQLEALAPQEAEVSFGFTFTASGTAILVRGSTEASLLVKLTWKEPRVPPDAT